LENTLAMIARRFQVEARDVDREQSLATVRQVAAEESSPDEHALCDERLRRQVRREPRTERGQVAYLALWRCGAGEAPDRCLLAQESRLPPVPRGLH
jgi:hypothetical protein